MRIIQFLVFSIILLCCINVSAQSSSDDKNQYLLEEVMVTASKREATAQETPMALSYFTSELIDVKGIQNINDLQYSVPSLLMGLTSAGGAKLTVRGISSESFMTGGDPGIALHIDGQYIQATSYALRDLFDIERIEVLRGSQGTLYGRNSTGGSVNIITKKPTDEFSGQLNVLLGDYEHRRIQAVLNTPLTDNAFFRIAVSDDFREGYTQNVITGDTYDTSDYTAYRGSLLIRPTDNLDILLSGYVFREDDSRGFTTVAHPYNTHDGLLGINFLTGAPVVTNIYRDYNAPPNPAADDPRKVRMDTTPFAREDSEGVSLDVTWAFSGMKFKSITGYHNTEWNDRRDVDNSDVVTVVSEMDTEYTTFTQEFQLSSNAEGKFDWLVGLFYYNEDSTFDNRNPILNISAVYPWWDEWNFVSGAATETESWAVFGQADYHFNDRLTATAGLRYTYEEKTFEESLYLPPYGLVTPMVSNDEESWEDVTGTIGLDYKLADEVMVYASVSQGFKAGGFNAGGFHEPYEPETVTAYQAGVKGRYLDSTLQLNLAGFYYDYSDLQLWTNIEELTLMTNAAEASIKGVEVEWIYLVTNALKVDGSVAYLDAEYDEYFAADSHYPGSALGLQDLSGKKLSRAPEWKYNIGAQYGVPLPGGNLGSLTLRVDFSWVDDHYFRAFNLETDKQSAYHRTDAKLMWESPDGQWYGELFVRNIEDEDVVGEMVIYGSGFADNRGSIFLPPRTCGVQIKYFF